MQQILINVGARIYDQESKENIERIKSFMVQAEGKVMGQVSRLLERYYDRIQPCDGTIVCQSREHVTKCYADSATDKQWRNQMSKILDGAK